jgi:hypothetical protein
LSFFIACCLWPQLATNLDWRFPKLPDVVTPALFPVVNRWLSVSEYTINRFGWEVGIANKWRMFGRLDRFNWTLEFIAKYADGTESRLPTPNLGTENLLPMNIFDRCLIYHREEKFMLNLYGSDEAKQFYCDHLAALHERYGSSIESIILRLHWQPILSPIESQRQKRFYAEPYIRDIGTFVPSKIR